MAARKAAEEKAAKKTEKKTDYFKETYPRWEELVARVEKYGVKALLDEYTELRKEKPPDQSTKAFEENLLRNRYKDVPCWDQSRVRIEGGPVDFIHGNWVDGQAVRRQFIATQGPLEAVPDQFESTVEEFWRMVWEQRSSVIVMLCQTVETGKAKCAQYWPERPGQKLTFGGLTVETMDVGQRNVQDHVIFMSVLRLSEGRSSRTLIHFLHQSWPDRKCPPTAYPIVEFLNRVHAVHKLICPRNEVPVDKSPMVVHCSAGIGRSGTFLAIDIALNLINRHSAVNIKEIVRLIRTQRHFAVQTPVQYVCIYQAILEFLVKHKGAKFDVAKFAKDVANVK